jgi:hypothetical protein
VGAEDDRAAGGHLVEFVDEHRALGAQVVADELVVHDFVAHVDRRAEFFQARSTMAMARSTPAQKPRGLAKEDFAGREAVGTHGGRHRGISFL